MHTLTITRLHVIPFTALRVSIVSMNTDCRQELHEPRVNRVGVNNDEDDSMDDDGVDVCCADDCIECLHSYCDQYRVDNGVGTHSACSHSHAYCRVRHALPTLSAIAIFLGCVIL